jgi:hypothetical protein
MESFFRHFEGRKFGCRHWNAVHTRQSLAFQKIIFRHLFFKKKKKKVAYEFCSIFFVWPDALFVAEPMLLLLLLLCGAGLPDFSH